MLHELARLNGLELSRLVPATRTYLLHSIVLPVLDQGVEFRMHG